MIRIGIDVGGTNTDAVMIDNTDVLGAVKSPTTNDVTSGIGRALRELVAANSEHAAEVGAVMIGTTHFVNAVVQRRHLNRAAALRICLPACASLRPMVDWPEDLAALADGGAFLVEGGHEYDGRQIVPLDETAIADAARTMRADGVDAVGVTSVFSPLTAEFEEHAAEILLNEAPDLRITLSSRLGRIGLLERENVTLLNASLA
ncbi:MAG: ROK family protein, partial [Pseudomonadota bacterium]|nr:ROK family protein [Pseudomonadota bacterium]